MKKFMLFTTSVLLIILSGNAKGEMILKTQYFEKNGEIAGIRADIINGMNNRLQKKDGILHISKKAVRTFSDCETIWHWFSSMGFLRKSARIPFENRRLSVFLHILATT